MEHTKTPDPTLTFKPFHTLRADAFRLSVSFALCYIGIHPVNHACEQLDHFPSWPEDMLFRGAQALKICQPAIAESEDVFEGETHGTVFVPHFTDEDFCELTLKKETTDSLNPTVICYRVKEHIRNETGELVETDGKPFGFGLPHPWKKDFAPNPKYIRLVEHRPGTDTTWPGFEPVWLKVSWPVLLKAEKVDGSQPAYLRLALEWDDENRFAILSLKEFEADSEEIPAALKSFTRP